ncbi:MAG TPA: VOC family protein [Candidatus Saccharimonadales bacterium]|nr:VOC family protein [Candidatus Saccharimonadales bacterium]
MDIRALSYVGIETADTAAWASFATDVLGMPVVRPAGDDSRLLLRMDERSYRFDVRQGSTDRMLWLGWEVSSKADLDAAETELRAAGVPVERGSADESKERGIVDFIRFEDPAGNRQEVFYGQEADFRALQLTRPMDGYLTGELGMGHAVIGVPNFRESLDFYTDVLGFRVSDTFRDFMAFLHCNPRHHSLALVGTDKPGLRHIMLETRSIDDVGSAIDVARSRGILTRGLGRHTNDQAVSCYFETPSGWEIEYGWSGLQVDDEVWIVRQLAGPTSLWGHEVIGDRNVLTTAKG